MRLSEAILLGMSNFTAIANQLNDGSGGACALGAAYFALGWMDADGDFIGTRPCEGTEYLYTWLKTEKGESPCGCEIGEDWVSRFSLLSHKMVRGNIAHIFNEHVMGDKTWTLEQLCDWVRSIEPVEPPVQEPVEVRQESTVSHD